MGNKRNINKKISALKRRNIRKQVCAYIPRKGNHFASDQSNDMTRDRNDTGLQMMHGSIEPDVADNSFVTMDRVELEAYDAEKPEDSDESLVVQMENQNNFQPVLGRRIIDINYFLRELQEKARHNNLFDCASGNFCLIGEKRVGLMSIFQFECNMCREICFIKSEKADDLNHVNINIAATTGIVASGIGFSQFEELCSAMNIPVFGTKYYNQLQDKVYENWEKAAMESMEAAAQKEKEIAIAEGRIKDGLPIIDVYVDGAWCARSYGTNFKASSGTAAIIGRKTRKVLFMGVKNKYCLVCTRAENKGIAPNEHTCFKNYKGSSSSMEAEIIVEGFKNSIPMYGIIYGRMIADGDASTYSKIIGAKPYQNYTVEKIECRNHILRNFCKKMRGITTETKYQLAHRKTLNNEKIMSMRRYIVKSIRHQKQKKSESPSISISALHKDILNSVIHAYGDHKMCQDYNCGKQLNANNELIKIQNSTFMFRINAIVSQVASKSRSLIEDVDTNTVECYNSVIAKFTGGKRVNYAQKRGYQSRCSAAVVSFNEKTPITAVQRKFINKNPGGKAEEIENRRSQKRKSNLEHPVRKIWKLKEANKICQHDYGPTSSAPDMSQAELETAKEEFLNNLKKLTADRHTIERSTVLQRDSSEWLEIRKNLITASNFGPICKRQMTRNTAPLVKNILYKKNLAHVTSVAHGIEHEQQAIQTMQQQEKVNIEPCGLFIDKNLPFIGATPDGLIGADMLVEVKCPLLSKKGLQQLIEENKIQILKYNKKNKTITINEKSNWFYQVQGQLHVTERRLCLFGIWAGENEPMHVEVIQRNDDFWKEKMEPKLKTFYNKCLLPELVNPRHTRGMPIRDLTIGEEKENIQPPVPLQQQLNDFSQPGPSTRQLDFNEF